jgi:hypothetical protein
MGKNSEQDAQPKLLPMDFQLPLVVIVQPN